MPQFTAPANSENRLDSDREVLGFPEGGVFGKAEDEKPRAENVDTLRLAQRLEKSLDDIQAKLDELSDEVDQVLAFPSDGDDDDWPSPAA